MQRSGEEDALHQMVCGITGKSSVKALSSAEASQVLAELNRRTPTKKTAPSRPHTHPVTPGGVSQEQQRKIWALMYSIKASDLEPNPAALGERLCGIIKRQFRLDASPAQPFRWMSFAQGGELIEILKKYDYNAAKIKCREGGGSYAK